MHMTRNCMAKAGGAIVGALAVTSGAIGATSHITGNGNFLEVSREPRRAFHTWFSANIREAPMTSACS